MPTDQTMSGHFL